MDENCSQLRCAAARVYVHIRINFSVCVRFERKRKIKMKEELGSAHKTVFLSLSFDVLYSRAPVACFLNTNIFPPLAIVYFACVCISECVCVCACGVFTITTYYNDCVCACSEMFRNLQFTRSTNSIEFYVSHQPVIMIICTKNTVSHVHKGHSENSSLPIIVFLVLPLALTLSVSHALSLSLFSICIHFLLKFLLTNSLGFTLECQAYKQYLCIN